MPEILPLHTGWLHVRFNSDADVERYKFRDKHCFVEIPPGYEKYYSRIPDEYIHEPHYNRRSVNAWWAEYRNDKLSASAST